MQADPENSADSEASLQLVLFVDERSSSPKRIQPISSHLESLRADYPFELTVVDIGERPDLAEHYRLVVTPALIKIHPLPRQSIAGSNLVAQLKKSWPRWQRSLEEYQAQLRRELPLKSSEYLSGSAEFTESKQNSLAASAELVRLSEEIFRLKQEKEELLDQLQFKDQVMSMLAHDLRSPLTAASIALETLELGQQQEQNNYSEELTSALKSRLIKHARNQFSRMDRMITDLLQAARGSSSEFTIRPHKLQLREICQDVLTQMNEQFQLKSQQVKTDIPQDLPCVYADKELVGQVLVNLLDNAIKYAPAGGKIEVSILHRTAQKIQVSVCDDGPGIPEENREHIFEGHFRLKRDEAKEGYGLGLSLCQKIIRAHYGRIWVDAATKGGGCFHFTLPVYR
ncbi:histidine kinase [Lyngbya aestuarii]|uniref:histidine kinase n=1 Tax=Lyngbya aestuarii TaxID=118322 RepID=UPI00403D999F